MNCMGQYLIIFSGVHKPAAIASVQNYCNEQKVMKMKRLIRKSIGILLACAVLLGLSACGLTETSAGNTKPVQASVIEIEKYGHAVLDLTTADFTGSGYALGDVVCVRFGSYESEMPFYDGYYTNPGGALLRGLAPDKNIAVCINYGDISAQTGIAVGDTVEITLAEKGGMLDFQELCALKYSNDRGDYTDDVTFANFRAVTLGRIGEGKLYRTASPINNEHGRAGYANDLIAAVHVAAVVNLADAPEDIEEYCGAADFDSAYYRALYEDGKVIALDMTANFYSEKFASSLAEGLGFLAQNEPPYAVHCVEGKDRAGFAVMVLAALMGADVQEIVDDYMISFCNYYGIDKENQPERYEAVLNNNLIPMLFHVTGTDSMEALAQIDLEAAVTEYLLDSGMSERDILLLKEKLG